MGRMLAINNIIQKLSAKCLNENKILNSNIKKKYVS